MSGLAPAVPVQGVIVDLSTLSANFPSEPTPELFRDNVVSTLKSLLSDSVYAVALEGTEGIGKTTVLSQFVRQTRHTAISSFVSAANRLSFDPDLIRVDVAAQVYWAVTGEVLKSKEYESIPLKSHYADLQRVAKQRKELVYFVVDGMEELDANDRQLLLQQLQDIFPIGIPQFRFLFSGDVTLYRPLFASGKLVLKSFPLTEFGVEDTRALFAKHNLTADMAKDINTICRSLPGRLAGVLRAMDKGMTAGDFVKTPPIEFFEIDWHQVNKDNETLVRVLALLAHDLKTHTLQDISHVLKMAPQDVEQTVTAVNFLIIEPNTGNVRFASEGLRLYAAERLKNEKSRIQKLLIKRLMETPGAQDSLLDLPQYLEDASEFKDLLTLLTPDHILQILERSQTLSRVSDTVSRGFRGAKKLNRDADLLRFAVQKCAIAELAAANVWESEVAALAALNRDAEALALANNAVLREDRLQMLAALAHGQWLRAGIPQPELLDQIALLMDNIDLASLGNRAHSIASNLICVSPDLATTLLKKAKTNADVQEQDMVFAQATLTAITDVKDENRRMQAIESLAQTQDRPQVRDLLGGVGVLLGKLSPIEVCKRIDEIKHNEAKLSVIRNWCVLHGDTPDADLVAMHGLKIALSATSTQIDASLLADLSRALAGASTSARKKELVASLDGVRGTAERAGPSVDYVRMQLLVATAEAEFDSAGAESRFLETLDVVATIKDPPARGESYARFLGTLKRLSAGEMLATGTALEDRCSSELESVVLILAESTADHYAAFSGLISALAPGFLEKALDYTRIVNTEFRRDAVLVSVMKSLLTRPVAEIVVHDLQRVLDAIVANEQRDAALIEIVRRFEDESGATEAQISELSPIISRVSLIENSVHACKALVRSIKIITRSISKNQSQRDDLFAALRARWAKIDMTWSRIDVGFGIASDLAGVAPEEAVRFFEETERLKSEWRIAAFHQAAVYIRCVQLAIRAFCGLLPSHLEKPVDIEALSSLIDIIPSYGERCLLWADLCLRASIAGRSDLTEKFADKYLRSAFSNLPHEDVAYRKKVMIEIAPAMYRAQPSTCLEDLDTLDPDTRDSALRQIIRFLVFDRSPSDPIESSIGLSAKTSYETLLKIESLTTRLTTDWMIYLTAEEVADSLQSQENRFTVNVPQREDISRRFTAIAETKLPVVRQITHPGYQIITLAQALRMRHSKPVEWTRIIVMAQGLGNVSDRVYVLQKVALCLPKNMDEQRRALLNEASSLIAAIPWALDQSDRYIGLAEDLRGLDSALGRQLLTQASSLISKSSSDDVRERQRRIVDVAFRLDEELASKLIEAFDDDQARRKAQDHVRTLEINKKIASNVGTDEQTKMVDQIRASETYRVGLTLVKALNAGRVQTYHPKDIRDYLELAAKQSLARAFPLLLWYVNNASIRYSGTEHASVFIRPIFNACVVSAQLTGRITGRALIRLQALKNQSKALEANRSLLVTPGSKEEAIRTLSNWFEKSLGDELRIHDPYFGPDDLPWLQIIRAARPNCSICVMTSRLHQPTTSSGEDLEDIYANSWRKLFDQNPPSVEIAIIGGEKSKASPIHDRWLVSGSSGLRFGTSFNSLGLTKDSEISEMSLADTTQKDSQIQQYLKREKTEHNGEKLRLTRFWLS